MPASTSPSSPKPSRAGLQDVQTTTSSGSPPSRIIEVRLFAGDAETIGANSARVIVTEPVTVGAVRTALRQLGDGRIGRGMMAVNAEYADDERVISPNDEVASIPPVAGG